MRRERRNLGEQIAQGMREYGSERAFEYDSLPEHLGMSSLRKEIDMNITTVRLYHPAPWGWLYSYQAILITLRTMELGFIALRYAIFRAPLLMVWTRLPVLRDTRSPYPTLAQALTPVTARPSLTVGGGQLGSDLGMAESVGDVSHLMDAFHGEVEPPSKIWSLLGCFLRGFFTDMGPSFIKLGQILSMREEIPPVIKKELQLLQDKLPAMRWSDTRRILERELGRPVDEVFEWVEEKPVAAGSLAQVHRAKLRREQEEVALKVQRPYLQAIVLLDTVIICDIFLGLVNVFLPLLHKSTDTDVFSVSYRQSLKKEIDFILESRMQERYRKLVMDHPVYRQCTKIARTYPQYTTTKLLTMELVKNFYRVDRMMDDLTPQQLLEFATTKVEGVPPEVPIPLVWAMCRLAIEGTFHWGFAHGDFHLGNLYVLAPQEEGDQWKFFICDFGMMVEMTPQQSGLPMVAGLSLSYYCDGTLIGDAFTYISTGPMTEQMRQSFREHMANVIEKYNIEEEEGGEKVFHLMIQQRGTPTNVVSEIMYGAATLGLKAPPFVWLFLKNFSYVAGIGLTLMNDVSVTHVMNIHASQYVKGRILERIEQENVTTMKENLPRILAYLRDGDREQVLDALATGVEVVPKAGGWVAGTDDIRFGKSEVMQAHQPLGYAGDDAESLQNPVLARDHYLKGDIHPSP